MARYIDADKLIWQVQDGDKYGTITKQVFISLLQNSETEDVVPVIHAHWNMTYDSRTACSNCKSVWDYGGYGRVFYCPYCGAKMDEEAGNGK